MATSTSSSTTTNNWLDVGLLKQYDPAQTAASEKLTAATYDPTKATVNAPTDTVQGQLTGLLDPNSALMQRAVTGSKQQANASGLLNSSMAAQAGQAAMIDKALPIASQDASTYGNFNLTNVNADNTSKQFNAQQTNAMGQFNVGQQNAINTANTESQNLAKRDYSTAYNSGLSTNAQLDQNTWATGQQVEASKANAAAQVASSQAIAGAQIQAAQLAAQATRDTAAMGYISQAVTNYTTSSQGIMMSTDFDDSKTDPTTGLTPRETTFQFNTELTKNAVGTLGKIYGYPDIVDIWKQP